VLRTRGYGDGLSEDDGQLDGWTLEICVASSALTAAPALSAQDLY
jgi:hypothetical protein